jgi:hypothetical protein
MQTLACIESPRACDKKIAGPAATLKARRAIERTAAGCEKYEHVYDLSCSDGLCIAPLLTSEQTYAGQFCSRRVGRVDTKNQTIMLSGHTFTVEGRSTMSTEHLFVVKEALRAFTPAAVALLSKGAAGEAPLRMVYGNAKDVRAFYQQEKLGRLPVNMEKGEASKLSFAFFDKKNNLLVLHQQTFEAGTMDSLFKLVLHELTHAVDDMMVSDRDGKLLAYADQYKSNPTLITQTCKEHSPTDYCGDTFEALAEIYSGMLYVQAMSGLGLYEKDAARAALIRSIGRDMP